MKSRYLSCKIFTAGKLTRHLAAIRARLGAPLRTADASRGRHIDKVLDNRQNES
jgi:hypothetical protein